MNSVGIVIPFFEYYEKIEEVCSSIYENNSQYRYKIFIVDNSKNKIPHKKLQNVYWIDCKPSIGFARACNVGAKYALDHNCDFLCFLNQDVIIKSSLLDTLIRVLSTNKNSILSPVITDDRNRITTFF